MEDGISIKDAAERLGVSQHTLRYYERAELLLRVQRGSNGHRRYSARDLDWLQFLLRLRSTGMHIADVAEYARLVRIGDATFEDRLALLERHERTVRAQVAEYKEHLKAVRYKVNIYREMLAGNHNVTISA